jgi:hypothetical protein
MKKLRHKFKNDGTFWMSFQDMLDSFRWIYKTRLFVNHWKTTQHWISISVPWLGGHLRKRFFIKVLHKGIVVIILSQV